jgi:WD40 repeat protein/energy-coupling factor transporter ATP-binding protein EcfA2
MEILNSQNDTLIGDSGFLAGRQRQVFDLLSLFQTSQLIGFVGENGSGKTTLIKKGLFPELEKGFLGIAGKKWKTVTIRPGITPLENLSAGIAQLGFTSGKQKLEEEIFLTQSMRLSNEGLKNACLPNPSQKSEFNSLLVIDNFEDLFQYRDVAANASDWDDSVKSFIQNITKCASYSSIPVYFLVVLRTQYMSRLFEYRQFYEKVSSSQFNLPQFRKSEFSEVVKTLLSSSKKKIHKDGMDFLYNQFGKDQKNLTLLGLYLREVLAYSAASSQDEIGLETLIQIPSDTLYARKLDDFFDSCDETQKTLLEKLFKQVTVTPDASSFNRPIRIDHFLKVSGAQLNQLGPLLQSFQNSCSYVFEVVLPLQERLEVKNHPLTSEAAVIDIKNDQFIPNWPRLMDWIKEERDSQVQYKNLSEKSLLFDKGLTDYLKSPDLDIALTWYEEQQPDVLWGNQFDSNYERTISYLLTSKAKFEEEILKKELAQKEKAKRNRKTLLWIGASAVTVLLIISYFLLQATIQQKIAKDALAVAEEEKVAAKKAEDNAKVAADSAKVASTRAARDQKLAEISASAALAATKRAEASQLVATNSLKETEKANSALVAQKVELDKTVDNLKTTQEKEKEATAKAINAQKYQAILNTISSLRIQIQNKDYDPDNLDSILGVVKESYLKYNEATLAEKNISIPNNNIYQVLIAMRNELMHNGTLKQIPENLESLDNGIRKITISPGGYVAAGGDNGILLYSKQPFIPGGPLTRFPIGSKDRIRSLEFVSNNQLLIGTVQGKLLQFNISTGTKKVLEVGIPIEQIVEQILVTPKGVFVLAGGRVLRMPLSELTKTAADPKDQIKGAAIPKELPKAPGIPKELPKTAAGPTNLTNSEAVPNLSARSIFKLNEEKLLIVRNDNALVLLDIATLQWQPINSDLNLRVAVTALKSSGGKLFLGLDNGNVVLANLQQLGNTYSIKARGTIFAHRTRITSLAYDESSNKLFTASLDRSAKIFDLKLEKLGLKEIERSPYSLEGFEKWIWDFALIQTGKVKTLLTVDEFGKLKSWQTDAEVLYNEIYSSIKK